MIFGHVAFVTHSAFELVQNVRNRKPNFAHVPINTAATPGK